MSMTASSSLSDLALPPLLSSRPVLPPEVAFEAALTAVARAGAQAGDLFWSPAPEKVELAIVLEPEVGPERAREMLFVLMVAIADSLGALAPPELAITWEWPLRIKANRGRIGAVRLVLSEERDLAGAPLWMVLGARLALKPGPQPEAAPDPGLTPEVTTLWDEGAVDLETVSCLESLSRHFLTWLHRWEGEGFKPVQDAWLFRCDGYRQNIEIDLVGRSHSGTFLGLDETGNLVMRHKNGETRLLRVEDALSSAAQE